MYQLKWHGENHHVGPGLYSVADCLASSRSLVQSAVLQTKQSKQHNKNTNEYIHYTLYLYSKRREKWKNENWIK